MPGVRVTKVDAGGAILEESSSTPSEERVKAAQSAPPLPRPRAARPAKTQPAEPPAAALSDRRFCLQVAVQSGETGIDNVINAAQRLLAFIEAE